MPRGEVCGGCMQPMKGGRCTTTSCKNYVAPTPTHSTQVGNNSGRFKSPNSLLGHPRTGLVADRGPQADRSSPLDNVDYQEFRGKAEARAKDFSERGKAAVREEERKTANKAIGKPYRGDVEEDRNGNLSGDVPEGCMIVKAGKTFGGAQKYKVVKDPKSRIWKK